MFLIISLDYLVATLMTKWFEMVEKIGCPYVPNIVKIKIPTCIL